MSSMQARPFRPAFPLLPRSFPRLIAALAALELPLAFSLAAAFQPLVRFLEYGLIVLNVWGALIAASALAVAAGWWALRLLAGPGASRALAAFFAAVAVLAVLPWGAL